MFTYLDAATGSMIASAVAGGAAGLSVAGKMGMRRLKSRLGKGAKPESEVVENVGEPLASETAS